MRFLQDRAKYWGQNYLARCQGDSIATPHMKLGNLFIDKDVLEIGPGEGRQFLFGRRLARSYAVADISTEVLGIDLYREVSKYLITGYNEPPIPVYGTVGELDPVDVIHFWYVLHHILPEELDDFVPFLYRHLKTGGKLLFNTPVTDYPAPAYGIDGKLTTPWDIQQIREALWGMFEIDIESRVWDKSTGYVIVATKKERQLDEAA